MAVYKRYRALICAILLSIMIVSFGSLVSSPTARAIELSELGLLITEIVPNAQTDKPSLEADNYPLAYQMFEIYNNSAHEVMLGDITVKITPDSKTYYEWPWFDEIEANKVILPWQVMVVWVKQINTAASPSPSNENPFTEEQFYQFQLTKNPNLSREQIAIVKGDQTENGFALSRARRLLLYDGNNRVIVQARYSGAGIDTNYDSGIHYSYPTDGTTLMSRTSYNVISTPGLVEEGQVPLPVDDLPDIIEETEYLKDGTLKIHAIEELNTGSNKINSHKGETAESRLELNRRQYIELSPGQLGTNKAMYPRLKRLENGSYILFYQDGRIGWNIYSIRSNDLVEWTAPERLFSSYKILGGTDDRCFSTADVVVLHNGDILAVSSFRANKAYATSPEHNGLMMRRSTDGGVIWGAEKVIYVGTNWEPYLLQLPSGEIQVYFTHTAPKLALENTMSSSGTAIIRSFDNGETWTPNVTGFPYAAHRVAQQYIRTTDQGVKFFTDQMPSAISLNDGEGIALAMESFLANGKYMISLAYSTDNWAKELEIDETGPADRLNNLYSGAAPYLAQFPSGETVLAYNEGSKYRLRIGDAGARSFGPEYIPYTGTGYWGATEVVGAHSLIATMSKVVPVGVSDYANCIMIGNLYLNHRIDANNATLPVDGRTDKWKDHTDALFLGSESQAQLAIRMAHDDDYLYVLAERLDRYLAYEDSASIFIGAGSDTETYYKIDLNLSGVKDISQYKNGVYQKLSTAGVSEIAVVNGTVADDRDVDTGYLVEAAIPLSLLGIDTNSLRVNAILYNQDGSTRTHSDTFTGASLVNQDSWLTVLLADSSQPQDHTPPEITVTMTTGDGALYANDTWTNRGVVASVYAKDDLDGSVAVEYSQDAGVTWSIYGSELRIDRDGMHALWFRAIDQAGNEAVARRMIKISTSGLSINAVLAHLDGSPYANGEWTRQSVTASIYADHRQGLAVTEVTYSLDQGNTWHPYLTSSPLTFAEDGSYPLLIRADDEAGNQMTENKLIRIDRYAPKVQFEPNRNGLPVPTAFAYATVSDGGSGVDASSLAFVWTNGRSIPETGWTPFVNGGAISKLHQAGLYLVIRASDIAGNTAHILYDAKRVGPCNRERGRSEIWQHAMCPPFSIISQITD